LQKQARVNRRDAQSRRLHLDEATRRRAMWLRYMLKHSSWRTGCEDSPTQ
jgi:hypothetical protein